MEVQGVWGGHSGLGAVGPALGSPAGGPTSHTPSPHPSSPPTPDPKAFYVIVSWESGAQIYELGAPSVAERKT